MGVVSVNSTVFPSCSISPRITITPEIAFVSCFEVDDEGVCAFVVNGMTAREINISINVVFMIQISFIHIVLS